MKEQTCRLCGDPQCDAREHYARARAVEDEEEGWRLELELLDLPADERELQ